MFFFFFFFLGGGGGGEGGQGEDKHNIKINQSEFNTCGVHCDMVTRLRAWHALPGLRETKLAEVLA